MSSRPVSLPEILAIADEHRKAGRLEQADRLCRQILEVRPAHPDALHLHSLIAHDAGDQSKAIELTQRAIDAKKEDPILHCNLAEMCRRAGRLDDALAASQQALALDSNSAKALNALGATLCALSRHHEAIPPLQRAIALAPDHITAHLNLGYALHALGRLTEALKMKNEAIRLDPENPDAFYNRGVILHMMGRLEEAEADWKRTLALSPAHRDAQAQLICNRGITLHRMGQFDEADAKWKDVITLRPAHADAHTNLGISYLLRGNLPEGFSFYEWRWRRFGINPHLNLHRPGMGRIPADKRLLIHTEQGLGDTLQFCRYLPMLRERGASLVFTVQQPLRSLIASSMPWLELGDGLPSSSNAQCRLLSLPHLLKTTLDTIPAPIPYIHPPEQAIASMGKIIGRGAELKVGLVWAGSPTHLFDKERSLTFAALAPILSVENIRFFSLQTGAAAREAPTGATDLAPELTDFAQTAGAIANLDLVITVDTSVAHLAGAMDKPVWIMLSFVPDWRWLLEREDSPWYPTARLFRQKAHGDWKPVISDIAKGLASLAQGGAARRDIGLSRSEERTDNQALSECASSASRARLPGGRPVN